MAGRANTSSAPADAPARALAVYAHPDDPEVACAGTLARWCRAGCEVELVSVARGEKGGGGRGSDLARRRKAESLAAAKIVGAVEWSTLGFDDGEIDNTTELRRHLVEIIRRFQPVVVLSSDPTAVFFGDSYINHRDHREVGWAVLDAVSPAAANGSYFPDAGPAHRVSQLYLSGTLEPNTWVDISETIDVKVAALACHASQLTDALEGLDVAGSDELVGELVRSRAAAEGRKGGLALAEGYRRIRLG
jgi:LmbE family N-acetylglucosaminyl deacetylase